MLKAGVLKPVHEAIQWINSFVLVEGKDKLGNLKLTICLEPTNLNNVILTAPYHFKTPEDIAYLLADACIMSVCNCKKGYLHQELDEASSFLTTFNTELGRFRYTLLPFGVTGAGDVFQCKLDQCLGHIKQVIVIADDIMIVGKKPNQSDHDQTLTTLIETARGCNVQLNYEKLQYKKQEVDVLVKLMSQTVTSLVRTKSQQSLRCLPLQTRNKYDHFLEWLELVQVLNYIVWDCRAHQRVSKGQGTFQQGSQTSICLYTDETWVCRPSHIGFLLCKETNCLANWCKYKRFRHMSASRRKTSLLCQQSFNRCTVGICSYWIRITCNCLGNGEIPLFPVCKPFHLGNQSEALSSNFIQEH